MTSATPTRSNPRSRKSWAAAATILALFSLVWALLIRMFALRPLDKMMIVILK
jgi:hypothetical protein